MTPPRDGPGNRSRAPRPGPAPEQVWRALAKASFAVISHVTPTCQPRSSGVMYAADDRQLYVVTGPDSWKVRHLTDGDDVAVTVPVRRGGLLALLAPIPPATITFRARVTIHPPGALDIASVSTALTSLLPEGRRDACVLELTPHGTFLTYGIGIPLKNMARPELALAHVPVAPDTTRTADGGGDALSSG